MHDQSIAWMISGGHRQTREHALQSIHRHALAEADASRAAEGRIAGDWRRAITGLFQLPVNERSATADCAC